MRLPCDSELISCLRWNRHSITERCILITDSPCQSRSASGEYDLFTFKGSIWGHSSALQTRNSTERNQLFFTEHRSLQMPIVMGKIMYCYLHMLFIRWFSWDKKRWGRPSKDWLLQGKRGQKEIGQKCRWKGPKQREVTPATLFPRPSSAGDRSILRRLLPWGRSVSLLTSHCTRVLLRVSYHRALTVIPPVDRLWSLYWVGHLCKIWVFFRLLLQWETSRSVFDFSY